MIWEVPAPTPPAGLTVSVTPPASPSVGQLWWESDSGVLYVWYNDGNSSQWVEVTSPAAHDTSGFVTETWGDWTPDLRFSGNAVGVTYSSRLGRYRKSGKKVDLWFDVGLTAKGTSTGSAALAGLPFPGVGGMLQAGSMGYTTAMTAPSGTMSCYFNSSTPSVVLTVLNVATTGMQTANETYFTNTSRFIGSVSYEAVS